MGSVDHKVIGIQYGITSLFFLLVGFCFMLVMRYQMAWPEKGIITPDEYNMLGAMHGTIMVFLGVVPLAVGAFGNYIVPVQIGAPDMAFPRLNMASYWVFFPGCIIMMLGFLTPGGAAQSGWTSYTPLSVLAGFGEFWDGQTMWLLGMVFLITSSLLGAKKKKKKGGKKKKKKKKKKS